MSIDWSIHLGVIDQAEEFQTEEESSNVFTSDSFIQEKLEMAKNAIKSTYFTGKRGSGKTMLIREAMKTLRGEFEKQRILPVRISYIAWLDTYKFPFIGEFKESSEEITAELFKGYFFVISIYEILVEISKIKNLKPNNNKIVLYGKDLKLDSGEALDFMKKLIQNLRGNIIPKRIINEYSGEGTTSAGLSFIAKLKLSFSYGKKRTKEDYEFSKINDQIYFNEGLSQIVKAYNIKKVIFYFDEIIGLGKLQPIFFNLIYFFRDKPFIKYKIFNYPYFYKHGRTFNISQIGGSIRLDRGYFHPDVKRFYLYFKELLKKRLEKYHPNYESIDLENFIDDETLKLLVLASGGNPRRFLNLILKVTNRTGKITINAINRNIEEFVTGNFDAALAEDTQRSGINKIYCDKLLNYICENLKERNKRERSKYNTNIVAFSDKVVQDIKPILGLLDFIGILEFIDQGKVLGRDQTGSRYYINPSVAAARNTFDTTRGGKRQFYGTTNNSKGLYFELSRGIQDDYKITIGKKLKNSINFEKLSEELTITRKLKPKTILIEDLKITNKQKQKLKESNIKTAHEIVNIGIEGLKKIKGFGEFYAQRIFHRAREEISDTTAALVTSHII